LVELGIHSGFMLRYTRDKCREEGPGGRWEGNYITLQFSTNKVEFHDQGDAKWIVIRGQLRGHNDTPFGQPPPGLSAAWGLAARWAYLVFLVTIN
jgi:hypothetical protein